MSSQSTLIGAAGEHYVMCQLLRRGLIAALAPAGVPNSDIIVTDNLGDRLCAIQVKTRMDKGSDGGWHMREKHENITSDLIFYCFVDFGKGLTDSPKSWIVPSKVVAKILKKAHQNWINTPGKKGQQRNDGDMRRFLPDYSKQALKGYEKGWLDKYYEAWDLLQSI